MDRDFSFFVIITNFLVFCQQPATLGSTLSYSGIILSPKGITSALVWRQKQTVQHIYLKMPKLTTGHFQLATKSGDSVNFRHIISWNDRVVSWRRNVLLIWRNQKIYNYHKIMYDHIKLYQKEMNGRVFNTILKCGSRSFNPDWGLSWIWHVTKP